VIGAAGILRADESGLRSDRSAGRTWAPIGQTPVTKGTGKRFKANMIAAISNTITHYLLHSISRS
jgi:hypothetical protein